MSKPAIALLGLGIMGGGMARNLLNAGYTLTVYNRRRERAEPLAAQGASVASSPGDAASEADIVISMVADDHASRSVWLGDEGALAGIRQDALLIESSTLTVDWVRELGRLAGERGSELLDAPVTGSRLQAAAGQLVFLVGGSVAGVERARPVLDAMGRSVLHIGPPSSGALIKLINNFMAGLQAASLGEAMALAKRGGLDESLTLEVLTNGAPGSPLIKTLVERMRSDDENPHFALQLMLKDLRYAVAEGERLGVPLRTAAAARDVFGSAVDAGLGEKDIAAVGEQFS